MIFIPEAPQPIHILLSFRMDPFRELGDGNGPIIHTQKHFQKGLLGRTNLVIPPLEKRIPIPPLDIDRQHPVRGNIFNGNSRLPGRGVVDNTADTDYSSLSPEAKFREAFSPFLGFESFITGFKGERKEEPIAVKILRQFQDDVLPKMEIGLLKASQRDLAAISEMDYQEATNHPLGMILARGFEQLSQSEKKGLHTVYRTIIDLIDRGEELSAEIINGVLADKQVDYKQLMLLSGSLLALAMVKGKGSDKKSITLTSKRILLISDLVVLMITGYSIVKAWDVIRGLKCLDEDVVANLKNCTNPSSERAFDLPIITAIADNKEVVGDAARKQIFDTLSWYYASRDVLSASGPDTGEHLYRYEIYENRSGDSLTGSTTIDCAGGDIIMVLPQPQKDQRADEIGTDFHELNHIRMTFYRMVNGESCVGDKEIHNQEERDASFWGLYISGAAIKMGFAAISADENIKDFGIDNRQAAYILMEDYGVGPDSGAWKIIDYSAYYTLAQKREDWFVQLMLKIFGARSYEKETKEQIQEKMWLAPLTQTDVKILNDLINRGLVAKHIEALWRPILDFWDGNNQK